MTDSVHLSFQFELSRFCCIAIFVEGVLTVCYSNICRSRPDCSSGEVWPGSTLFTILTHCQSKESLQVAAKFDFFYVCALFVLVKRERFRILAIWHEPLQ